MATHRIPILGAATNPHSGDVYFTPLSTIAPTNDLYESLVLAFNDTSVKDEVSGIFQVPVNYGGTAANIVVLWTSTVTSGNVVWDFDYNAIGVGESADPSSHTDTDTVTDAAPGTTMLIQEAVIALTAGDFAAEDSVLFQFGRDGAASDTLAGIVIVLGLLFEYDD